MSSRRDPAAELVTLAGDVPRLDALERAGQRCGWCAEPLRLRGVRRDREGATNTTVATRVTYLKACGTRRATRCAACAARYRQDAKQIVLSGLEGGKGIDATVAAHPAVFATLTAPSFGVVHRARRGAGPALPCRPGPKRRCMHGRALSCDAVHDERDHRVGEPLCPDCYEYEGAVLWNALCPELSRRTTIYCRRELARQLVLREKDMRTACRVSFVKVAEYQRRGTVHLHVVARLDPVDGGELPVDADTSALMGAVVRAVRQVAVAFPGETDGLARFGAQLDVRPLFARGQQRSAGVAGYLAKYAVKSSDDAGALDRRIRSLEDLAHRKLSAHHRRLAETAWRLGEAPDMAHLGLRRFAHGLGFRGHWMTKSRAWSVTFAHLRAERAAWRASHERGNRDEEVVVLESSWHYVGHG